MAMAAPAAAYAYRIDHLAARRMADHAIRRDRAAVHAAIVGDCTAILAAFAAFPDSSRRSNAQYFLSNMRGDSEWYSARDCDDDGVHWRAVHDALAAIVSSCLGPDTRALDAAVHGPPAAYRFPAATRLLVTMREGALAAEAPRARL
jgi:hypothetical protein